MARNTRAMQQRVMKTAWHIRAINKNQFYGNWTVESKLLTWKECLQLAWKLIKSWSGTLGDIVRESIEISRPNGGGFLKSAGSYGMRYTIK